MDDENLAARMHGAAHDPSFPARREAAFAEVVAALDQALTGRGYLRKGATWTRTVPDGRTAIHLQRNRYGWEVQIILRALTIGGEIPAHPDWPDGDDVTLARFGAGDGEDPGRLAFLDVLDQPACLGRATDILVDEALPWLASILGPPD